MCAADSDEESKSPLAENPNSPSVSDSDSGIFNDDDDDDQSHAENLLHVVQENYSAGAFCGDNYAFLPSRFRNLESCVHCSVTKTESNKTTDSSLAERSLRVDLRNGVSRRRWC